MYKVYCFLPLKADIVGVNCNSLRGGEIVNNKFTTALVLFGISVLMIMPVAKAHSTEAVNERVQESVASNEKKVVNNKKVVKNKNAISVPGYVQLSFVADEKEQTTILRNPEQNNCYFKITIVLSDGTVIWKSDFMAPGERAEHITLLKALPEGTYENVMVKYDCFAMNKKTALNNARIKLELKVKKKQEVSVAEEKTV